MAATETFTDVAQTTVTAGGNIAQPPGTSETWTVTSSASFPAASTGVTQFHIADPALPLEIITVTNVSGTTWTVTRGTGTNALTFAHSIPFTVKQVVPAGFLTGLTTAMTNPMTTAGDLITGGVSGAPGRLAVGTAGQYLAVTSGAPAWATLPVVIAPPPSGDTTGATDTAAVQPLAAALAAANGGVVQFLSGRYYITQLLLYPCVEYWGVNVSLAGGLPGTIITAPAGVNPPAGPGTGDRAMVVPASASNPVSCGMRRLTLDGGNGTNPTVLVQANQFHGIALTVQASRTIWQDINIMNTPGDNFRTAPGASYAGCQLNGIRGFNAYGRTFNLQGSDYHLHDLEAYTPGLSCYYFNCTTVQATELKSNYAGARGVVGDTYGIAILGNSNVISGGMFAQNDVGSFQSPYTFTATLASPCVFTVSGGATSPANGTQILLSGTVPTGFTASTIATGPWTVYYVVASSGTVNGTFELAATPGGAAINSTSTGNGTATPANGVSVYVAGARNEIKAATAGASFAHLMLDTGASDNNIDITTTNQDNTTHAAYIYQVNAANAKNNTVKIVGQATTMVGPYGLLTNGGTEMNNQFQCEGEVNGAYSVAFAASVTPDPYQGSYVAIGTLTGVITINNPANGHAGTRMTLRLTQDGTGGRTVTFGGNYKVSAAIPTTLSTTTEISFICDAVGGTWRETGRATA